MKENNLSEMSSKILEIYKTVSGDTKATYPILRKKFLNYKLEKPLVHNSRIQGLVASNGHILETDPNERSIEEIFEEVFNDKLLRQ